MSEPRASVLRENPVGHALVGFVAGMGVMGGAWMALGSRSSPPPAQIELAPVLGSRAPASSVAKAQTPIETQNTRHEAIEAPTAAGIDRLSEPGAVREEGEALDDRAAAAEQETQPTESAPSLVRLINVNTASLSELDLLPGIGPALAQRIIDERSRGRFRSASDLERVRGIGPRTVEKLEGLISFE